jgi:ribosomal protein L15
MIEDKYNREIISKAVDLYWVFNRHLPKIGFTNLPEFQKESWCHVALAARDRAAERMMEDINTELRDRLWTIMQQCADQLGVNIEVDRY